MFYETVVFPFAQLVMVHLESRCHSARIYGRGSRHVAQCLMCSINVVENRFQCAKSCMASELCAICYLLPSSDSLKPGQAG